MEGVRVKQLVRHPDDRGFFQEILREDRGLLRRFGPGVDVQNVPWGDKGFPLPRASGRRVVFPVGNVQVVLHHLRGESPTYGETNAFYTGDDNPIVLLAPAGGSRLPHIG